LSPFRSLPFWHDAIFINNASSSTTAAKAVLFVFFTTDTLNIIRFYCATKVRIFLEITNGKRGKLIKTVPFPSMSHSLPNVFLSKLLAVPELIPIFVA
jgi:hypothetical protein